MVKAYDLNSLLGCSMPSYGFSRVGSNPALDVMFFFVLYYASWHTYICSGRLVVYLAAHLTSTFSLSGHSIFLNFYLFCFLFISRLNEPCHLRGQVHFMTTWVLSLFLQ